MPTQDFTTPGNYTWSVPLFVDKITITCIGAGGSGHSDTDGDDLGGGGGGGAFCRADIIANPGSNLSITVGDGGTPPNNGSRPGGSTVIVGPTFTVDAGGGGGGTDNRGGGGGGGAGATGTGISNLTFFNGGAGDDDDQGGEGGSAATQFGGQSRCGSGDGGAGTNLDGNSTGCPTGRNGRAYGGGGCGRRGSGGTGDGAQGAARIVWNYIIPEILSFTASPNPQTSGNDGTPNYNTTLSWETNYPGFTYTITSPDGFSATGTTSISGSLDVTNLPQSTAGTTSPSTRTYTLTLSTPYDSDTASVTVEAYNDNTPDNYTVSSPTNVEPSTVTTIQVGPITGIDMVTTVTAGTGVSVSNNNLNFSSFITIQNNGIFYVRATSLPFNTSPNGLTNSASFSVTVGTLQRFFTLTTRAPDVNETFNFSNKSDYVPYPDIDTIPDPDADIRNQSNPYIQTNTLLVDDVELGNPFGVEIKTDNPNAQVRVRRSGQSSFGPWEDVRSI